MRDGVSDCVDASDELLRDESGVCPDATPSRHNRQQFKFGDIKFCRESSAGHCSNSFGQICIVSPKPIFVLENRLFPFQEVTGSIRCVCDLGLFRPAGISTCVPIGSLQYFASGNFRHRNASNCTNLLNDLFHIYPGLFKHHSNGQKNASRTKLTGENIRRDQISGRKVGRPRTPEPMEPGLSLDQINIRSIKQNEEEYYHLGKKERDSLIECNFTERNSCKGLNHILIDLLFFNHFSKKRLK